ncbi:MAG: hypothetical protein SGCHY_005411, partial [Lobulomycetales sp.]
LDVRLASTDTTAYAASLDGNVYSLNLEAGAGSFASIGKHEKGVKAIVCNDSSVFSGSWDKYVKQWDPRAPGKEVGTYYQGGRVFSMSASPSNHKLVVATSAKTLQIFDTRSMQETPLESRESPLKYPIRTVACMPNGKEGRVALEYFEQEDQELKYAFKCHRKHDDSVQGGEIIYPVNAIAFHPVHGTFASGGCDGVVSMWDGQHKKRIKQLPAYSSSIAALDFNCTGELLAVASSYTFEEGEKDHPPDSIYVREMTHAETAPKVKK